VRWGLTERSSSENASDAAFPLTVSDNRRYLVDQRGQPWRIQADAGWIMSAQASQQQVDEYLTIRRAQGFNAFYLMAMVHPGGYRAAPDAPRDLQGNEPFARAGDFSSAGGSPSSERYWAWIDTIVHEAAAHGMVAMLAYTYLGYDGGDQGWYQEILDQPSRAALFAWGRWLGERYQDDANVIWLGLGDYTPPAGSEGALRVRAIADGIKAAGARQLFMAEPSSPDQIPGDVADFEPVLDLNSFYGYGPDGKGTVYETADRAWALLPTRPAWMQEGTYEYENNMGHFSGQPWDTRRGRYWSVLAGGTAGDGFGSTQAWQWENIPASLTTPGATYSSLAFELFSSLPWWDLRPSGTNRGFAGADLVTAGGGAWGDLDYITSALTADARWLLAYAPVTEQGPRAFEVDLGVMNGPVRARWFDPATGNYLAISDGYELDNTGTLSVSTPGSREDGTDDWLLVLDAGDVPRCGTISPTGTYTAPPAATVGVTCEVTATLASDLSVVARQPLVVG
jgi:hypothetical protein